MRFLTAGESHGPKLTTIIEGLPAGLFLAHEEINHQLARRQMGYGRGGRMQIETDCVEIASGIRHGRTLGSPLTLMVENKDWPHWQDVMGVAATANSERRKVTRPRPGHADLVGGIKYQHRDLRNVLERSSARETTMRVAAGAVAQKLLHCLEIEVLSHVIEIGGIRTEQMLSSELMDLVEVSPVRCADVVAEKKMLQAIDMAKGNGDTLGGIVEVVVLGLPAGIGSYVHADRKLDARLASALMSIHAFKGIEFGMGFAMAGQPGSEVQDEIIWDEVTGYSRKTNRLGGIEGGMSNGMPLVVRAVMKPIPTLYQPLQSVDIESKEVFAATVERSDTCAVPAAAVIAENVVAWELASAIVTQFHSDNMEVLKKSVTEQRVYEKEF